MTPRVLLGATARWATTARLAIAFSIAGCQIDVIAPRGHPVTKISAPPRVHRYHVFAPLRSFATAIDVARPDLVIPCDDLATAHLHALHQRPLSVPADADAFRALLARSLGDPANFAAASARTRLMKVANKTGIRVPLTSVIHTAEELTDWLLENGCPAVLKTDGSYGGGGVRIVHTLGEALNAWKTLSSPPSPTLTVKRMLVNHDMNSVLPCAFRIRPVVNVQEFVPGQDANVTVACWNGTVLASITARVLRTLEAHGPASVVEITDVPDISSAVAKVVGELRLSGLLGFDFIIHEYTGDAHLIEMNPRATQICHLPLGPGRDLPAALRAVISGEALPETPPATKSTIIALFPQEWLRDPASPFLKTAYHDVPWDQPDLLRACLAETMIYKVRSRVSARIRSATTFPRRRSLP
jgi:ATP-grasp domain